jgi:hypothetical protein
MHSNMQEREGAFARFLLRGELANRSISFARRAKQRKKKKEAGQVFPPPYFPLAGNYPADLTEGGQPVVCWPVY